MIRMIKDWKIKLALPLLYFGGAVVLFYTETNNLSIFTPVKVVGMFLAIAGFLGWIIARVQLGNAFSLRPQGCFLVQAGLYRKIRHPVYFFSLLALGGVILFLERWVFLFPFFLLFFLQIFRVKKEEGVLIKNFKEEYLHYKKTSWF